MQQYSYAEDEKINDALSEEELMKAVKGVQLLGIRSKTKITKTL